MKKFVKETSKKFALGALAILATIGSVSAAPGDNTPTGTIKIPRTTASGDEWVSESEQNFGSNTTAEGTIPAKGYQTTTVYNYEMKVSWGDLKFIYDRGQYNPNTNRLTKKVRTNAWAYCEGDATQTDGTTKMDGVPVSEAIPTSTSPQNDGGVNYWCGFDGVNNRVDVENLGNGDVTMNVSCTETTANVGSTTDMQIGVLNSEGVSTEPEYDGWQFTGNTVGYTLPSDNTHTAAAMTFAEQQGTAATTTIKKGFDLSGAPVSAQEKANQVRFYLNITGAPGADFSELDATPASEAASPSWQEIGTINLSFTGLTTQ
ncbi:MAG: hypothetical protein IJJ04_02050 [Clostridia bacterium]|nr:hypothetical protein [Clostridia bacterium]